MYAVIRTGGKQERVEEGQTLAVELLGQARRARRSPSIRSLSSTGKPCCSRRELAAAGLRPGGGEPARRCEASPTSPRPGPAGLGSPPALHDHRDHRHQRGARRRSAACPRPKVGAPPATGVIRTPSDSASRCSTGRRSPPASIIVRQRGTQLPPRRQCRARRRRHPVRPPGRQGEIRHPQRAPTGRRGRRRRQPHRRLRRRIRHRRQTVRSAPCPQPASPPRSPSRPSRRSPAPSSSTGASTSVTWAATGPGTVAKSDGGACSGPTDSTV